MFDSSALESFLIEGALINLALRATEAESDATRKRILGTLINEARVNIELVSEIEGTHDYIEAARNLLHFTSLDARLLMEVPPAKINHQDAYSAKLKIRRKNLPHVLSLFEKIIELQ